MKRGFITFLAGACAINTACYDLDVTAVQPGGGTAFTREEVLRRPELIELVVAGLFINFWGGATYAQPWFQLSLYGEEVTSAATTTPNFNRGVTQPIIIWDFAQEPRTAFDNSGSGVSLFARDPWSNFYEANAAATEMSRLVKTNNLVIRDPATGIDNTHRTLTFAKFLQGMAHVHLGMLFDSASVITEDVVLSEIPIVPFKPYREVVDSGIAWLEETIRMTKQGSFAFPLNDDLWIYNTAVSNDELGAIAHTYIARAMVYSARNPTERAAVNWARVIQHLDSAVTGNFGPLGTPNPVISMDFRQLMAAPPSNTNAVCVGNPNNTNYCGGKGGVARIDLRLLGPADSTTAYATWLDAVSQPGFKDVTPFIIRTRDKRIQEENGTTPLNVPTYFKFTNLAPPISVQPPERGSYYWSNYWSSSRGLDNKTSQLPADGGGRIRRTGDLNIIPDHMVLAVELDLLRAEALYNLGGAANLAAAAALINKTRAANGGFGAADLVTAAGVPVSTGCVPRRYDGSCGTLFDALMYEKRIETYGTAIAYFDLRGWGCLLEGTPIHLPPPGRQLDILGKPIYTFGGIGGPGSAPKPTNCPLLHKP